MLAGVSSRGLYRGEVEAREPHEAKRHERVETLPRIVTRRRGVVGQRAQKVVKRAPPHEIAHKVHLWNGSMIRAWGVRTPRTRGRAQSPCLYALPGARLAGTRSRLQSLARRDNRPPRERTCPSRMALCLRTLGFKSIEMAGETPISGPRARQYIAWWPPDTHRLLCTCL